MDPINARCKKDFYPAYHTSGKRKRSDIIWVVLHDTEGGSAHSIAEYFEKWTSGGSAHLVVDDKECYRCLGNETIPWGAPGANKQGFHIEQVGYAKWSAVIWKSHINTLKRAAYKTALHCKLFNIPIRFVKADDLVAGKPGITTHREVSKAFDGTHSDPGPFYPLPVFMWLVRHYSRSLL
jgi:hypothetical protein